MIEPSAGFDDEIHCSIETVELSNAPQYYALSYAWGDANITEAIKLGDCSVRVTTNLAAALRRLRCWEEPTKFWIDAISINQNSVMEKNHQVPLMATIYSQAVKVVMWLGEEGDDSKLAIALVKRWTDGIAYAKRAHAFYYDLDPLITLGACVEDAFHTESLHAVHHLLSRNYWSRIWIVQEVVLAKNGLILCGDCAIGRLELFSVLSIWGQISATSLPTKSFPSSKEKGMLLAAELGDFPVQGLMRLISERSEVQADNWSSNHDTLSLLQIGFERLCTDPRDRFYALFGLMNYEELPMRPNYRLTPDEVTVAFTIGLIQTSKRSDAISFSGIGFDPPEDRYLGFSTWVPHYNNKSGSRQFYFARSPQDRFRAAAGSQAEFIFQNLLPRGLLHARGILCGEISGIFLECPDSGKLKGSADLRWVWSCLEFASLASDSDSDSGQTCHPSGIPWRQAFFRTLIADESSIDSHETTDHSNNHEFYNLVEGFFASMRLQALQKAGPLVKSDYGVTNATTTNFFDNDVSRKINCEKSATQQKIGKEVAYWSINPSHTKNDKTRVELLRKFCGRAGQNNALQWPYEVHGDRFETFNARPFAAAAQAAAAGRCFYMTGEGYMGLAPRYAEKGDLICVLLGCSVPIIIRKKGDNYVVVGDTYVYGMMQGEMMSSVEKGRLQIEDLTFE